MPARSCPSSGNRSCRPGPSSVTRNRQVGSHCRHSRRRIRPTAFRVRPPALSHDGTRQPTGQKRRRTGGREHFSCAKSDISSAASRSAGHPAAPATCSIPNTGEVQAKVALASKAEVEKAIANARGRLPGLGRDQSAAPRARDVQVPRADPGRVRRPRAAPLLRARQDLRGRQGRHPARARGGRVRLRHSASAEGRVHRGRRARASTSIRCASRSASSPASRRSISPP